MAKPQKPYVSVLANVLRGGLMGGADIIPGVSGGTVALILGIYGRLVAAISHFDVALLGLLRRRQWRAAVDHVDLVFLVSLGSGIALGIGGLATLMNHLLTDHLQPTLAVFFGLILASSALVARTIGRWRLAHFVWAAAGGAFAYWLVAQPFMKGYEGYPYLFLCGNVAICAMILPGISGAFVLLILGKYHYVTAVLRDLVHGQVSVEAVLTVVVFTSGCVVGLLAFSKFLRWLLARWPAPTMAVLCGFMLGSLRRIWPFKDVPPGESIDLGHSQIPNAWPDRLDGDIWLAIGLGIVAAAMVFALDALARRHGGHNASGALGHHETGRQEPPEDAERRP